jgi:hypothetical protein
MDDLDKVPLFDAGEAPRRSTSSLGVQIVMPLTRPYVLIYFAAALLLAQGIYGLVNCWLESVWGPALFCVVAIISGFGLAYRRWWSRPATVALALLVFVPGIWVGWRTAQAGVYHNRHAYEISLMAMPGLLYMGLTIFCVYVALRYVPGRTGRAKT